jgi:Sulfotransferase family
MLMSAVNRIGPTFVVGVPRSGTTLLVNLLGAHPLLAPIYETRFLRNLVIVGDWISWSQGSSSMRKYAGFIAEPIIRLRIGKELQRFRTKAIQYNEFRREGAGRKRSYETFPFGESSCVLYTADELIRETDNWLDTVMNSMPNADIWSSARQYVNRLFSLHCARMGRAHWINKTPGLLNHLDGMNRLFPEARYIHIMRDGRDVAASNLSLPWGPKTVREAARRWKHLILKAQRDIRLNHLRSIDVTYEEFVRSPAAVLPKIFGFLDLAADIDHVLSAIPIVPERVGSWRCTFTAADRKIFAREAGDLLKQLGYESSDDWAR